MDTSQLKKLMISAYIEDKNRNKYLISNDSAYEKKALLKNYADIWNGIKK